MLEVVLVDFHFFVVHFVCFLRLLIVLLVIGMLMMPVRHWVGARAAAGLLDRVAQPSRCATRR